MSLLNDRRIGRREFLLFLVAAMAFIFLAPIILFVFAKIFGGSYPAVLLMVLTLYVLPPLGFALGLLLLIITRSRLRDLGLSNAFLILFPILPVLNLVVSPYRRFILFDISSKPLYEHAEIWIGLVCVIMLSSFPGLASGKQPDYQWFLWLKKKTEDKSTISITKFRKINLEILASLALVSFFPIICLHLFPSMIRSDWYYFPFFCKDFASILIIFFAQASVFRRLNNLKRSHLWVIFYPLSTGLLIDLLHLLIFDDRTRIDFELRGVTGLFRVGLPFVSLSMLIWLMLARDRMMPSQRPGDLPASQ